MKFLTIFLHFLLIFSVLRGQETLSLSDLKSIAQKESELIKAHNESVDAALHQKNGQLMNLFPTANIKYNHLWLWYLPEVESMGMPLGDMISPDAIDSNFLSGLAQADPGFGSLSDTDQRLEAKKMLNFNFGELPAMNRSLEISVTQPITPLYAAYKAYNILELNHSIAKESKNRQEKDIETEVTIYYYQYSMLVSLKVILEKSIAQFDRYIRTVKNFINAGISDNRSLLKIRLEKSKVSSELHTVNSRINVIKTALSFLINRNKKSFELEVDAKPYSKVNLDIDNLLRVQEKNRFEIKMLKDSEEIKENLHKTDYNKLIPMIALTAGYKRSFDEIPFQPKGTVYAGGVLNWDIGIDWYKNYKDVKKSKSESIKTKLQNIDKRKKMKLQVISMFEELLKIEENIKVSEIMIEQAKENLRIEENKHREHMTTETDLLDASLAFKNAKTTLLTHLFSYQINIQKLAGTIGISAEELYNPEG